MEAVDPGSERWRVAFVAQATENLRQRAMNFARRRAYLGRRYGGRTDSSLAEEWVHDALADTWIGVLSWDPDRVPLLKHVYGAIRSRARHERKRMKRRRHYSIEVVDDGDALGEDIEDALTASRAVPIAENMVLSQQVIAILRQLADGDREITMLLDAFCAGITQRADLLRAMAISPRAYDAARNRLDRLVDELPQSAARDWSRMRRRESSLRRTHA